MLKTLIVEDELDIQKLINIYLSSLAVCDFANDGLEGLKLFKSARKNGRPYDLVILDILMPNLDGGGMLKQLRAWEEEDGLIRPQGTKVIVLTVLDENLNIVQPFKSLGDGYIIKPFSQTELLKAVKNLGFN